MDAADTLDETLDALVAPIGSGVVLTYRDLADVRIRWGSDFGAVSAATPCGPWSPRMRAAPCSGSAPTQAVVAANAHRRCPWRTTRVHGGRDGRRNRPRTRDAGPGQMERYSRVRTEARSGGRHRRADAVDAVQDPELHRSLGELDMVRRVTTGRNGRVEIELALTPPGVR